MTRWWFVFYREFTGTLGLHAVIPQLMRPMDIKATTAFLKQTMLSPQYVQLCLGHAEWLG